MAPVAETVRDAYSQQQSAFIINQHHIIIAITVVTNEYTKPAPNSAFRTDHFLT